MPAPAAASWPPTPRAGATRSPAATAPACGTACWPARSPASGAIAGRPPSRSSRSSASTSSSGCGATRSPSTRSSASARTLATEIRSSDHIARIDRTRFAVLLTETEEIAAINFVERVRAAFEQQPGELRVAIGWASPTGTSDLHDALATAEARLVAEIAEPGAEG